MSASGIKTGSYVNKSEFNPVKADVAVLKSDIIRIDGTVAALGDINVYNAVVGDIAALQQSSTLLNTEMTNLTTAVTPIIDYYPTLKSRSDTYYDNFNTVANTLTEHDTRITLALVNGTSSAETIASNAYKMGLLADRVTEAEGTITSHTSSIASHNNTLGLLNTAIGLLSDTDTVLDNKINTKQNILSAGSGIVISGDTISAVDSNNGNISANSLITENNVEVGRLLVLSHVTETGVPGAIWYDATKGFMISSRGYPAMPISTVRRGSIQFVLQRTSGELVSPATFGTTFLSHVGAYSGYNLATTYITGSGIYGDRTIGMKFTLTGLPAVSPTYSYSIDKVRTRFQLSEIIEFESQSFNITDCNLICKPTYEGVGSISFTLFFNKVNIPQDFEDFLKIASWRMKFEVGYDDYNFV